MGRGCGGPRNPAGISASGIRGSTGGGSRGPGPHSRQCKSHLGSHWRCSKGADHLGRGGGEAAGNSPVGQQQNLAVSL